MSLRRNPSPSKNVRSQKRPFDPQRSRGRNLAKNASKPELLAPAGSPESFVAAITSGADAVYVGLKDFNARHFAQNFKLKEFKKLLELANETQTKVYLAFNSALKATEIKDSFLLLARALEMGPSAVILQDLGIIDLTKKYFPEIPLHASTLIGTHNLDDLEALKILGFSRAVLPRELTFLELADLAWQSPIETEIFIHGALCYSFSGLCLFSSFLGGKSAARGGCAQPCRRAYANSGRKIPFFSTNDLETAPFILELKKLPIVSFKIEGRMKGPDYVENVVKAYRLLIDADTETFPGALAQAREYLNLTPERPRCSGFLKEISPQTIVGSTSPSGLFLGTISLKSSSSGEIKLIRDLNLLDKARLVEGTGEEGKSIKFKEIRVPQEFQPEFERGGDPPPLEKKRGEYGEYGESGEYGENEKDSGKKPQKLARVEKGLEKLVTADQASAGTLVWVKFSPELEKYAPNARFKVYKTGSGLISKEYRNKSETRAILKAQDKARDKARDSAQQGNIPAKEETSSKIQKITKFLNTSLKEKSSQGAGKNAFKNTGKNIKIWYWVDSPQIAFQLKEVSPQKIIVPVTIENVREFSKVKKSLNPALVWSLPPLMFAPERMKNLVSSLIHKGAKEFLVSQLGMAQFIHSVDATIKVYGDYSLGVLNPPEAEKLIQTLKMTAVSLSPEIDLTTYLSFTRVSSGAKYLIYLLGRPRLFTARFLPSGLKRGPIISPKGEKFWGRSEGDVFSVESLTRVFFGEILRSPPLPGLLGYIVDLRHEKNPGELAKNVHKAVTLGRPLSGSRFNFKRGLV
ncbi:MAG: U32 family peptidase [Deltaproteobacteria bacterium]|jgi:collagenase-like PrtC family protease|nr:U32 family peptidase [Deltaproteobacteria bacterium]